jgi:flagellar motor switch protein FliN/FliY
MSQFDEVFASSEWAFAFAEVLGRELGDDRILTVGEVREDVADVEGPTRAVALEFTTADGEAGTVTLVAGAAFAAALERAASDEILVTSCATALEAAARAIGERVGTELDQQPARETETQADADDAGEQGVIYPLLDGGDLLGCVTLRVRPPASAAGSASSFDDAATPESAGAAIPSGASYVLADVEMGVTAELGRCRMTVRELLSITPGAVIDLDRAAGAPVDVLVNGTLIARGEVVVIDEEFGIRISELIPQPAAAR